MSIKLISLSAEQIPELSRICHVAFKTLHERHRVHADVPDLETGRLIVGMVASRPDYAGVTAVVDGKIAGSNFLLLADDIGGVGPITVDPESQGKGVGRALMSHVVEDARRRMKSGSLRDVRLFQEAVNTTSLSLYTSLGFAWRDSAALMQGQPSAERDTTIRPIRMEDLPKVGALSQAFYGASRVNDSTAVMKAGIPGFIRERERRAVGYLFPTLLGHAAAERDDDLLALAGASARDLPPPMARFICPLGRQGLFDRALARGHRTLKVLNYMSLGNYSAPPGAHFPSIQC